MKKKIGLKIFIPMIMALIVLIPVLVSGKDYGEEFDKIFGKEEGFVIHSDEALNVQSYTDDQLREFVRRFVGKYYTGNVYESDGTYYYNSFVNDCNSENMTCNIRVDRTKVENGMSAGESEFKKYENVKITIDSNITSYFDKILDSDGVMTIKYDESFFKDNSERNEYIERYVSKQSFSNSEGNWVSFSYDPYAGVVSYEINAEDFKDNFLARAVVKDINFDATETEYSEAFKHLTDDGNLTIKTNGDITNTIVDDYLTHSNVYTGSTSYSFEADGDIIDNKFYVAMYQYGQNGKELIEKHLVTLVKDSNIDKSKFALVNMADEVNIAASEPTERGSYINNYFNTITYRQINDDKNYNYNFDKIYGWNGDDDNYIRYIKYDNDNGNAVDIQYNKIDINFTGYSDVYSDEFRSKFENGITVRADEKSESAVSNKIGYSYGVLSCNSDVSVCDIALSHKEEKYVEIHKVNITFDNSVSEDFKKLFNLNEDGTIDVVTDTDLNDISYFHYYNYDATKDLSVEFSRDGDKLSLSLNPYSGSMEYERHSVDYKIVNSGPSAYFKNNVYLTKDFYPGESTGIWNAISHNYYFDKDQASGSNANAVGCDKSTGKCKVMLLNNDRKLEIHEVQANIKSGKSPEFAKAFPKDKVHINAIYKDDETYLFGASSAYFMSKTKDWIYLSDFTENSAKVRFNDLEVHSFDVEYSKGNEKHAKAIEKAKEKLEKIDLTSIRKDLEFVNKFYYDDNNLLSASSFNSKTLNDKFNKAVKDRHIGYFVVPEGGGGTPYESGAAGRLVLFYDGIAYDVLDDYVDFTNFNVIYIPSNTKTTPEEYVKAAQKRVDEYLGKNSGVVISHNGPVIEDYFDDAAYERYGIDKNKFDNNEYLISYKDRNATMLIVADSSKMQKPDFAASDVTENISVTSETVNYPSNTVVMSDVVDKDDSEYSKILDKAKVKNAHIVDINLYSSSVGDIEDFDEASFNVSVPVEDESLQGKELVAYYIDDEGNVEEHPVVMDEFMATFETTHFSTYIIAEKKSSGKIEDAAQDVIQNPNTVDNVLTYVLLLILSGMAIGGASYKFIKREN